jgi:branched-chain amino acid transport system ATP-binding protein
VSAGEPVLVLESLTKRYGALHAVDEVSFTLARGARHAVIGPNGAGKSTLFNLIAGTVKPSSGRVLFNGIEVTRRREHQRTLLGMSRTFQHSSLFEAMSAVENVATAVQRRRGHARNLFRPASSFADVNERAVDLHAEVGLVELAGTPVGSLSHGHRRQLEVALALAAEPNLLLLDEPTAGMSRDEAKRFIGLIGGLSPDLTIMLVEHDMDIVFGVATEISVLDAGRLIASGPPEEIRGSAAVQEAYLGPGERIEQLFEPA